MKIKKGSAYIEIRLPCVRYVKLLLLRKRPTPRQVPASNTKMFPSRPVTAFMLLKVSYIILFII